MALIVKSLIPKNMEPQNEQSSMRTPENSSPSLASKIFRALRIILITVVVFLFASAFGNADYASTHKTNYFIFWGILAVTLGLLFSYEILFTEKQKRIFRTIIYIIIACLFVVGAYYNLKIFHYFF